MPTWPTCIDIGRDMLLRRACLQREQGLGRIRCSPKIKESQPFCARPYLWSPLLSTYSHDPEIRKRCAQQLERRAGCPGKRAAASRPDFARLVGVVVGRTSHRRRLINSGATRFNRAHDLLLLSTSRNIARKQILASDLLWARELAWQQAVSILSLKVLLWQSSNSVEREGTVNAYDGLGMWSMSCLR